MVLAGLLLILGQAFPAGGEDEAWREGSLVGDGILGEAPECDVGDAGQVFVGRALCDTQIILCQYLLFTCPL